MQQQKQELLSMVESKQLALPEKEDLVETQELNKEVECTMAAALNNDDDDESNSFSETHSLQISVCQSMLNINGIIFIGGGGGGIFFIQ